MKERERKNKKKKKKKQKKEEEREGKRMNNLRSDLTMLFVTDE